MASRDEMESLANWIRNARPIVDALMKDAGAQRDTAYLLLALNDIQNALSDDDRESWQEEE